MLLEAGVVVRVIDGRTHQQALDPTLEAGGDDHARPMGEAMFDAVEVPARAREQ